MDLVHRRRLVTLGYVLGIVAVATAVVRIGVVSGRAAVVSDGAAVAGSLVGLVCCGWAARRTDRALRRSWLLFGACLALYAVADLIGLEHVRSLGGVVPMLLGLVLFPVGTWRPGALARVVLDVSVVGAASLLISQLLVMGDVLRLDGRSWVSFSLLVHPSADVLMAGLAVLLLLRTSGRARLDLALLALALGVYTYADNGFALLSARGVDHTGGTVAIAFVVAPLLVGLAALRTGPPAEGLGELTATATRPIAVLLPDLLVLAAAVTCVVVRPSSLEDWTLAGVTLLLTANRQLVGTTENNALRERLEEAVARRTAQLHRLAVQQRSILESAGEGIFGVDGSGRISFVNPATAELLGRDDRELVGRPACATVCSQPHDTCVVDLVRSLGDPVAQALTEYVRGDGTRMPVEISAAPMPQEDGTTGAVVVFHDVTERLAVETMKRAFAATVSHELRTPLTAIRGALEMLEDGSGGTLSPQATGVVELALRGTNRLARLVNDIIDLERMEAGTFDVVPEPQDVGELVCSTVDSLQAVAREHGVHLVCGEVGGHHALADADRVTQCLVNLMGNAMKFTPAGRTVTVSVSAEPTEVVVAVTDQGRGIPEGQAEAIFERFHQVHQSDSRNRGGAGLGLTITRSIVERHGGRIWAESAPDQGATFRFTLPAVPLPEALPDVEIAV